MLESSAAGEHLPTISDFYDGKSVFLTGASGFVGSVLLETLLRCCPGIKSIFILLRQKKNVQPLARKEEIFKKKIFQKLQEERPESLRKVHVISGDISLPNLGMCDEDTQLLVEEASVVFHCAAVINFVKPLKYMLVNNVLSLSTVIGLCKQMKKFEALVHTSTAFCNANHENIPLKEEVYRLPFHSEKFLDAIKNEDNEKLQELVAYCKPDWPNSYTFSKCLGENVILDTAGDLPVAIIRPSIVWSSWKNPIPGYIEENSGIVAISLWAGKGFIKVLYADPNVKLNIIPVDIVANAHVLAAWSVGTKRCASPLVVNCTATDNFQMKISEYNETMEQLSLKFPIPGSFEQQTVLKMVPYKFLYFLVAAYHHYLPAIVLDGLLKVFGKKPKLYRLYRFVDEVIDSLKFFMFRSFEFERGNMEYLDKFIHPGNREDLALDFKDATLLEISLAIPEACLFYDWKIDRRSQSERQNIKYKRHILITCIQGIFQVTCWVFVFWVLSCLIP